MTAHSYRPDQPTSGVRVGELIQKVMADGGRVALAWPHELADRPVPPDYPAALLPYPPEQPPRPRHAEHRPAAHGPAAPLARDPSWFDPTRPVAPADLGEVVMPRGSPRS